MEAFQRLHSELLALAGQAPALFQGMPEFSVEALETVGRHARENGVAPRVRYTVWNAVNEGSQQLVLLFPKLRSTWDDFDYTRSHRILEKRFDCAVNNGKNTCATDVLLFTGIHSGAVIRQIDAISFKTFCCEITPFQRKVRLLLARPWGLLPQETRDRARDELIQAMDRKIFKENGMIDVQDLAHLWFDAMPSFAYTALKAIVCCDREKPRIISRGPVKPSRCTILSLRVNRLEHFPHMSLDNIINGHFAPRSAKDQDKTFACKRTDCQRAPRRIRVILDRLPPMLIVSLGGGSRLSHNPVRSFFGDISVEHTTTGQRPILTAPYFVEGVIFRIREHFIGRWKGKGKLSGKIVHCDSTLGAEVSAVDSWTDGLSLDTQVSILFYRRYVF